MRRRDGKIQQHKELSDICDDINSAQSFVWCQGIPAGIILRRSKSS